jgi:hypothetical protein
VPVKMAEQQGSQLLHRGREQLVRQRTMLVNALRAHLAEFGMVAAQGLRNVGELIAIVRDDADRRLPAVARQVLQVLANLPTESHCRVRQNGRPIRLHRNGSSLSSWRRDCESKTSPRILKRNWKFRLVFGRRIMRTGPRWIALYPCSISCV